MRKGNRGAKTAVTVGAALCVVAVCVALAVWQPWTATDEADRTVQATELESVPAEWLSTPSEFESEEDAERYAAGEWRTDRVLRSEYSFVTVTTDGGVTYVAGELLASVPSGTSDEQVGELAERLGASYVAEVTEAEHYGERIVRLVFPDDTDMEAAARSAQADGLVESAEPNFAGTLDDLSSTAGADPLASQQAHLSMSRFSEAQSVTGGAGAVIAVLDSGVDADHEDLAGNLDMASAYDAVARSPLDSGGGDEYGAGLLDAAEAVGYSSGSPATGGGLPPRYARGAGVTAAG